MNEDWELALFRSRRQEQGRHAQGARAFAHDIRAPEYAGRVNLKKSWELCRGQGRAVGSRGRRQMASSQRGPGGEHKGQDCDF